MKDENGMLIKSPIPQDAASVCVEDFCGYSQPGHFPTQFWADYFPQLGFTRFGGDHWNVPDMPCTCEPSEEEIKAWTIRHLAQEAA